MRAALRRARPPWSRRRFFAYALGVGKTGSHSLAALLSRYHSEHEPMPKRSIDAVTGRADGSLDESRVRRFLLWRDRFLGLELEASPFLRHFVDLLPGLFPRARFILLTREPLGWLDSTFNHRLARPCGAHWVRLGHVNWPRGKDGHPPEEALLAELGLPSIDRLLQDWARGVEAVEKAVPADRLLVVRTHEIPERLKAIADFLGVPLDSLRRDGAHSYKAARKYGLLARLPAAHVEARIRAVAGPLAARLFPERWA